jgi:hypothetical protein
MANRNLLKEAIADAKSVKEAAIANAKAALEEAFTPYLKERFSAKLAEMELEEGTYEEDNTEMEENYSEGEVEEKMSNPVMRRGLEGDDTEEERTEKMRKKPEVDEMNLDELLAELDEELSKDKEIEETLNEQEEETEEEESEEVEGEEDDEIDLEDMTEDELKDLIEDVIADMVRAGELEAGEKFEDEEDDEDDEEIDFEEEDEEEIVSERKHYGGNDDNIPSAKRGKIKKDTAEEEGIADYEKSNKKMEEGEINELKNMTQYLEYIRDNAPEVMDVLLKIQDTVGVMPGASVALAAATAGVAIPTMIALDLKKGEEGKSKILNTIEKVGEGAKKLLSMLKGAGATEEIEEQLEELTSTLFETKLLNAKLLYTNKIFRAKNLNETQKVKVLEAFDKATSVRDAKLIYETLTTVKETKTAVTESMRGMASKAAGMAPEKKPILEVNDQFARWQILAGIKRN